MRKTGIYWSKKENMSTDRFSCESGLTPYVEALAYERVKKKLYEAARMQFGCLTGDCPHEKQTQCDEAIEMWIQEENQK